jgi:tetratricopeptide (TPR) repeat protein
MREHIGYRYQALNKLGAGGMGIVYTAIDRLTGQTVALKQVTILSEHLDFSTKHTVADNADIRLALAQEFYTLASLRHPNIISVIDYGFDQDRQPYFVIEYLAGAKTILRASADQPFETQLQYLIQLLQALAYLHQRGVVHRDLKPDNILVVDGQVKVLDFGLAISPDQVSSGGNEVSGTLAYMAPELLVNHSPSKASDLYAVGVIAWQMFTGHHPFRIKSVSQLVTDILNEVPDSTQLNVDPRVSDVIVRLLLKNPADRYNDAHEIIQIFAQALGQTERYETEDIRESFLQAAQFVGREAEKSRLLQALSEAIGGNGSVWLVGGESGVGKSRLLDEIRIQALVDGALVLRGQAVAEGGNLYQVWRSPVRRLALNAQLSDLDAGLLKMLVPDIHNLLDRPIPDPPEMTSQALQDRLLSIFEGLFAQTQEPVVVIVEDLHWAGSESLAVFKRLIQTAKSSPILVIGSYRDDETPDLPTGFPGANTLKLGRLGEQDIERLSESMLGAAGKQEAVVHLIQRETEGNVFFVVEVVRALAEEAGELRRVGQETLPDKVFAGGIQNIVRRRLARVAPHARPILDIAAVVGRQVNLGILGHINPEANLEEWLTICHSAAVLDVVENRWRFSHDKLREQLLFELAPERRAHIHQQVAQSYEALYPDNSEYFADLTYHWGQAGNTAKEARYALLSGNYALRNGAYKEAITLLETALAYYQQQPDATQQQALIEGGIGEALFGLGRFDDAAKHLTKSVELFGYPIAQSNFATVSSLIIESGRQLLHRAWPSRFFGKAGEKRETILHVARLYDRLSVIWYLAQETKPAIPGTIRALNLAEWAGVSAELARNSATMGNMVGILMGSKYSRGYFRRALEAAQSVDDRSGLGWVHYVTGYHHSGFGEWQAAEKAFAASIETNQAIGSLRTLDDTHLGLAHIHYYQGNFRDTLKYVQAVEAAARARDDANAMIYAMTTRAHALLALGQLDEALAVAEQTFNMNYDFSNDRVTEINGYAALALAHFRAGNYVQAWEAATTAMPLIAEAQLISFNAALGYSATAEVFLGFWEQPNPSQPLADVVNMADQICAALNRFSGVFRIAKPQAQRFNGLRYWLMNKPKKAHQTWQKGLTIAESIPMRCEHALIHYEIGRHLPETDSLRQEHLKRSHALFEQLGAPYYLDKTARLLTG